MSWLSDLAGKAENILNNIDLQTGAALRHTGVKKECTRCDGPLMQKGKVPLRSTRPLALDQGAVNHNNSTPTKKPLTVTNPLQLRFNQGEMSTSPRRRSPANQCPKPIRSIDDSFCTVLEDIQIRNRDKLRPRNRNRTGRRYSLPSRMQTIDDNTLTYKLQDLEIANALLQQDMSSMNDHVVEMLDRLNERDGYVIDTVPCRQPKNNDQLNHRLSVDKSVMKVQLEELKQKLFGLLDSESNELKCQNEELVKEVNLLTDENNTFTAKYVSSSHAQLLESIKESNLAKDAAYSKLETEFRHSQVAVSDLQAQLVKSQNECANMCKEWDTYKFRVKNMLAAKDEEIRTLKDGEALNNLNRDSMLFQQIELLKNEREELSNTIDGVRQEYEELKKGSSEMEDAFHAAERLVEALREALKEERMARNEAEAQFSNVYKEFEAMQMKTSHTITSLRLELQDKDNELNNHDRSLSKSDSSALNVADYDVQNDVINTEKVAYLTQLLMQKQAKIKNLYADNNTLKIQLKNLQSKSKTEVMRSNSEHSIVQLSEAESKFKRRPYTAYSLINAPTIIWIFIKRNPLFRIFVLVYMIFLHLWVFAVLFSNTPDIQSQSHIPIS